jgi:hypothetical protein
MVCFVATGILAVEFDIDIVNEERIERSLPLVRWRDSDENSSSYLRHGVMLSQYRHIENGQTWGEQLNKNVGIKPHPLLFGKQGIPS